MARPAVALIVAAALAAGCRSDVATEAATPWTWATGDSLRLTFNPGDERSPTWLGNDSIVYASTGFPPLPDWPGVLAAMPRKGGTASLFLPVFHQSAVPFRLVAPAVSPTGNRVAFVDLTVREVLCPGIVYGEDSGVVPLAVPPLAPPLVSGRMIVRARSDTGVPSADPQLVVDFPGVKDTTRGIVPGPLGTPTFIVRDYPFQQAFRAGGAIAFRPSWSPDGQRLVFSDGLRLLIWTVGQPQAVALPGGDGGTVPAWSPRGDQIAFTRLESSDSSSTFYLYYTSAGPVCSERRVRYRMPYRRLMVLPAAGGTPRDLGTGEDPAWSADGGSIYARSSTGELIRVPAAGGAATTIPGLGDPYDLAVSPDGHWLAFTRSVSNGNHDVWVVRLSN